MADGPPSPGDGAGDLEIRGIAGDFITGSGKVRIGQLIGVMISSVWLTITGGFAYLQREVTTLLIREVRALEGVYATLIRSTIGSAAGTIRYSYATALESAIATSPILAPGLFTLQLLVVFSLVEIARRRFADG
jgi:hypothetical protein